MTRKKLNELGFDLINHNTIWHGATETEFKVLNIKKIKTSELVEKFFNIGFDYGVTFGKTQKMEEVRKVIGLL